MPVYFEEKYCLWVNESGHPTMDLFSRLSEKIPIGGYVPCIVGNKREIERLLKRLLKKPYLIERYIKTISD
jgi:hypothetical protein